MSSAFYNERDGYAAGWLRNLVAAGHLPAGTVDQRSILDIEPADLDGYRDCHFFAGIGGWPLALALAGWPADRPVWTGSCPCQPFSSAGKQSGAADERHLWPQWLRLIRQCRPDTVLGEQVAGAVGFGWLDRVFADLEALGYACGAAVLGAHSVGAPHIRQRLFWVADRDGERREGLGLRLQPGQPRQASAEAAGSGAAGGMADAERHRTAGCALNGLGGMASAECGESRARHKFATETFDGGATGGMADAGHALGRAQQHGHVLDRHDAGWPQEHLEAWADAVWLGCLDGKARRVEPGIFPLAHGVPARVGRLRAYGNAIVPQAAAEFVTAFMERRK